MNPDGETFLPHVPELRNQPIFGPRMLAMIGWLKSRAHCSYSTIAIWMDDVLQVPVSRGYLAKLCNGTISASLAAMHEQLKQAIPRQSRLGSDESSLKNNGKKNRFMFEPDIEPTNNHSEQQVRRCVIDRRPFYRETGPRGLAAKRASDTTSGCGLQLPPAASRGAASSNSSTNRSLASLSGGEPPRLLSE